MLQLFCFSCIRR